MISKKKLWLILMEHFIEKNILIDDLLELEISYIPEILDLFNELRQTNNIDYDIVLLNGISCIVDSNILETEEYLKSLINSVDHFEFEYNYVNTHLNDLYIGKHKIQTFINKVNIGDHLIDLISEMNIK
jgi:hypothetical protein